MNQKISLKSVLQLLGIGLSITLFFISVYILSSNRKPIHRGAPQPRVYSSDAPTGSPTPVVHKREGFITSQACLECHSDEYNSWHDSYHRTMTQIASPDTVVAPFDDVQLKYEGQIWKLERRGDEFWIDMPHPIWERELRLRGENPYEMENVPRHFARVVMTTGSHHRQSYWVNSGDTERGNELHQIPWTFQIPQQKWIPLDDAFVQPPSPKVAFHNWNRNCINCHSVAGKPGVDPEFDFAETSVGELGIACEACHGPGEKHVEFYRKNKNALTNETLIINPAKCSHEQSSQICGSCHSFSRMRNFDAWWKDGRQFRPGQNLEEFRIIRRLEDTQVDSKARGGFWEDGTVRTGGREFQGLSLSSCYTKGKLSCITCHSMHDSDPNHQLAEGKEGSRACSACHQKIANDIPAHTHHPVHSSGSACYNCHMPFTSYALLSVVRSHRIDSPHVLTDTKYGRPNACNVCHLDKTLKWTATHLQQWYGTEAPMLSDEHEKIAASVLYLHKGDAGQRAILAANFGQRDAREASGTEWMAPHLASALNDPYSAVRWMAFESLKQNTLYDKIGFDFVGSSEHRSEVADRIHQIWKQNESTSRADPQLLFDDNGVLDQQSIFILNQQRDDRSVYISE